MATETMESNGQTERVVLDHGQTLVGNCKKPTIKDIPQLPRELTPFAPFTILRELDQRGPLFQGPGSKRDTGRYKVRAIDEDVVKRAKKFAMEQSVKYVMLKQQQHQQKAQLELMKKQQALLLMCRTYIGSINFELNEAMLKQAFQPFGPVKSVSLTFDPVTNRHKGFAFLEYETPEAAQLSIEQMNGVILGGRNIKVGRPSNMPQAQPIIDQLTEEAKNYNRIYVASIHLDLTEKEIQSVFEAFGTIKSCVLAKDTATGKHKGYGFIEYETAQAAKEAITAMNLFDLGGQYLRVGKAITPPDGLAASAPAAAAQMPVATAVAAATIAAQLQSKEIEINPQSTLIATPIIQNPLTTVPIGAYVGPNVLAPTMPVINPINGIQNLSMNSVTHTRFPTVANNGLSDPTKLVTNSMPVIPPQPQIIEPPIPVGMIPKPTILEEPPVPVGLRVENQAQQNYPSISLTLPTKAEKTDNQKATLPLISADDTGATLSQQEELSVRGREQRHLLMQKLNQRLMESRVCILRNMVGADEVDEDLEKEITEECSKYGIVDKVVIYIEKESEEPNVPEIVKIFVAFQNSKGAEKSAESLNGRWFGGRIIKAEIYDESAFEAQDFSG